MTPPIPPPPMGYKLSESVGLPDGRCAICEIRDGAYTPWAFMEKMPRLTSVGAYALRERLMIIAVPDPAYDWRVDAMEFWSPGLDSTRTGEMTKGGVHHAEIKGMAMDFNLRARVAELQAKLADAEARIAYLEDHVATVLREQKEAEAARARLREELTCIYKSHAFLWRNEDEARALVAKIERGET